MNKAEFVELQRELHLRRHQQHVRPAGRGLLARAAAAVQARLPIRLSRSGAGLQRHSKLAAAGIHPVADVRHGKSQSRLFGR